MSTVIYKFDNSKKNRNYLDHNLEIYNYSKCEYLNPVIYKKQKKFGFYAYDNKRIVGGAYGYINDGYWCYLDYLFVDENYRRNNIASSLIKLVEDYARKNNCVGIRLETWSFQAKGFYEKNGYEIFGKLENHPPTTTLYMLKKVLIDNRKDLPKPIR